MATRRLTKKKTRAAKAKPVPTASLLVELLTEELPPKSLQRLSDSFAQGVFDGLKALGFLSNNSKPQAYATPRRLAVVINGVLAKQADQTVERRGPAVAGGLDAAGKPTPALLGFARSCGVDVNQLARQSGDKGEYFVHSYRQKGEPLKNHLAELIETVLKKLPVAKLMRWGAGAEQFVRPVHGILLLHGNKPVAGVVLGLKSRNKTLGHRFLSRGLITIPHADKYAAVLRKSGKVIGDFFERRGLIEKQLLAAATKLRKGSQVLLRPGESIAGEAEESLHAAQDIIRKSYDSLLDEVSALVEWPKVYVGHFDKAFLQVPIQCLALSMQQHQKYFPLVHHQTPGYLLPSFLMVSNIETNTPHHIIHGNERVLRARLSDACFFFEHDKKIPLSGRIAKLANVVYHNKLGSQLERVQRLQKVSVALATSLGLKANDQQHVERAAYLAKADLLTDMVGEFPELQGVMGAYYAEHDKEPVQVVAGVVGHYYPRFAGDRLPTNLITSCVALADRLDTLVGIYGIGLVPTGDKDPFGLRRQALGILRILTEKDLPLDIRDLLALASREFPNGKLSSSVVDDLYGFMLERFKSYARERGFQADEIEAVLSLQPTRFDQALKRLQALQAFRRLPEADALAAANKRIQNILKQAGDFTPLNELTHAGLKEQAEKHLLDEVQRISQQVMPQFAAGDYASALAALAKLRTAVDSFFEQVMVMAEDVALRQARLTLLSRIRALFLQVADISRLQS